MFPQRSGHLARTRDSVDDFAPAFDVVVLCGSAGGMAATTAVLRSLPPDFDVPLLVMLHLPLESDIRGYYQRLSFVGRAVEWVRSGSVLDPRKLLVCPPRARVEVLPNGSCLVSPDQGGIAQRPIDGLLDSVARSFGHRAIAVILTGMGDDGAAGAHELHAAGGRVLVQTQATSEFPGMPKAAVQAGAADLVVPLQDIGQVLGEIVAGTPRPKARSEIQAIRLVFGDKGEVAELARSMDWSETPLGPALAWPLELRLLVRTALDSPYAMAICWGPDLSQIYNDSWRRLLGSARGPQPLGGRARESWPEIWHIVGPMVEQVMASGQSGAGRDYPILIDRKGYPEEIYATFSHSAIRNASGAVVGVQNIALETTENVIAERRMRALRVLTAQLSGTGTPREACERAASALASDPADVPFALFYTVEENRDAALSGVTGLEAGSSAAPQVINTATADPTWPIRSVLEEAAREKTASVILDDLAERFPGLSAPALAMAGARPPHSAMLRPLYMPMSDRPVGVLILGLSPHRPFDDGYQSFIDLVVQQINAGIIEARAKQLERERMERLAELDRLKTEFFSNVSHEFRTPLMLLLAPLEDLSREREHLPPRIEAEVDVAIRNARRLLRLVDSLLDFSEIEARRQHARVELTDLAALTKDVVSAFESTLRAGGLRLRVEIADDLPRVPVNRDMWEKIVSNLLSNAFKFTFEGEIFVRLRALRLHVELEIADSGVGIPKAELSNVFKRFHRVRGARARTAEGSGIGLAIVHDLVQRMGGQITVRSTENRGTTFTIWLPFKLSRLVRAEHEREATSEERSAFAAGLATEAGRWLANSAQPASAEILNDPLGQPDVLQAGQAATVRRARLLVVDDNADVREYLSRLLSRHWEVHLAADGTEALAVVGRLRPDVIVADLMMPGIDGLELLKQVRERTLPRHTPFILLSARAGEQAAIKGLLAGADDCVAKPFSPRELVARVATAIERARAEEVLRERAAWLRGQREALEAAVNDAPLEVSLEPLVRTMREALGGNTRAAIYLCNSDRTSLHHVVGMSAEYARAVDGFRIGAESLACGLATHTGEPVITVDVQTDPLWEPWRWMAERFDYRGCWSFPIFSGPGTFIGTLAVYSREPRDATEHDRELASLLTNTASIIIARHNEAAVRKNAEQASRESGMGVRRKEAS